MPPQTEKTYHATESKYKGGAQDMYVTYDLEQKTRGGGSAEYPKVKRVYIAGDVQDWRLGQAHKRSGRTVYGMTITYEQTRAGYHRKGYTATRGDTTYHVAPADVEPSSQVFTQVVEVPERATNVHFYQKVSELPEKYASALQDVR